MKNNKALGQHWLYNRAILEEIAELACGGVDDERSKASVCVEIGPGLGTLTASLLRRFDEVIAVEFDERLAQNLPGSFPGKNLKVINGDILSTDLDFIQEKYVIAGNIPYYITSPIIKKVLTLKHPAERVVLLVQKEVADRLVDEKETVLSLFVKNYADVKLGPVVLKGEFTPPPKVDSAVIVLKPHAAIVEDKVFELIKRGFKAPRKKLVHNLMGLASKEELTRKMAEINISLDARPGDLKLEEWQKLSYHLSK